MNPRAHAAVQAALAAALVSIIMFAGVTAPDVPPIEEKPYQVNLGAPDAGPCNWGTGPCGCDPEHPPCLMPCSGCCPGGCQEAPPLPTKAAR